MSAPKVKFERSLFDTCRLVATPPLVFFALYRFYLVVLVPLSDCQGEVAMITFGMLKLLLIVSILFGLPVLFAYLMVRGLNRETLNEKEAWFRFSGCVAAAVVGFWLGVQVLDWMFPDSVDSTRYHPVFDFYVPNGNLPMFNGTSGPDGTGADGLPTLKTEQ
jgi:hypothetical protein